MKKALSIGAKSPVIACFGSKLYQQANSPLHLLDNLQSIIYTMPLAERTPLEQALNSFLDHDQTAQWLNGFNGNTHGLDAIIDSVLT